MSQKVLITKNESIKYIYFNKNTNTDSANISGNEQCKTEFRFIKSHGTGLREP